MHLASLTVDTYVHVSSPESRTQTVAHPDGRATHGRTARSSRQLG
jgi:hypothetical protein